ncbi:MAG: oligosaccharide flippase family protein [Oryzihumus sp.]
MTSGAVVPGVSGTRAPDLGRRSAAGNMVAFGLALGCVTVASLLVARLAGPAVLGEYTLLRVLPWLTGVVVSCGLPVSSAFHLAAPSGADPRLRPTLATLAGLGVVIGVAVWSLATPLLHAGLLQQVPRRLLLVAGATVATRLLTVWGKACCQGTSDMRGANLVIVAEEFFFIPAYAVALAVGPQGITAVVAGLVGCGVAATAVSLGRVHAGGFFRGWGRPSPALARSVTAFGARGQLSDLLMLVNLRLDFLILGGLAGPAVLGQYAVASKCAELMRLPSTACNYVLYPRFARAPRSVADAEARRLAWRCCLMTVVAVPLMVVAAVVGLPLLYGSGFRSAVVPACVLVVGLAFDGAAAVASAYLRGVGHPGTNSIGIAVGVTVTVALDVLLIPRYGALGAAVASSVAYLTTTAMLVLLAHRLTLPAGRAGRHDQLHVRPAARLRRSRTAADPGGGVSGS